MALEHSLGHLSDGVRAINYLYDRMPEPLPDHRMKTPLSGSPVSCRKLRSRLADVVQHVPCACRFPAVAGRYDNPLRHLDDAGPPMEEAPTLENLLDQWGRQLERLRRLQEETDRLRERVATVLSTVPDCRWDVEGGSWVLADGDVCWEGS